MDWNLILTTTFSALFIKETIFYVLAARHGFANVPGAQAAALTMGGAAALYLVISAGIGALGTLAAPVESAQALVPVLLAGAGIRGGQVYGASDRLAAYPTDKPVFPADLAATIFSSLGVDPHTEIRDRVGRPHVVSTGQPLAQLF